MSKNTAQFAGQEEPSYRRARPLSGPAESRFLRYLSNLYCRGGWQSCRKQVRLLNSTPASVRQSIEVNNVRCSRGHEQTR